MDKQTLSGYGWIVIVTLLLAVLLALATPFGTYVGDGVTTVVNGFINTNAETLSDDSIDSLSNKWEQKFENGVNNAVPTVYELKKKYDFTYYSTLEEAISTVNTGVATVDVVNEKDAEAGVYVDENGRVNVVLLKDIELNSRLHIATGMCFNLGGKTLDMTADSTRMGIYIDTADANELVTIDGRLKGSKMNFTATVAKTASIMIWNGENVEIIGCEINGTSNTGNTSFWGIYTWPDGNLTLNKCNINLKSNENVITGIRVDSNCTVQNCNIDIETKNRAEIIWACKTTSNFIIKNCNFSMKSHYDKIGEQKIISGLTLQTSTNISDTNIYIEIKNEYVARGIEIQDGTNVNIANSSITLLSNSSIEHGIVIPSNMASNVTIENTKVNATNNGIGRTIGVYIASKTTTGSISNSQIDARAHENHVDGVINNGTISMTNTTIFADFADNIKIKDGVNYDGINMFGFTNYTNATATINDCKIYGGQGGVSSYGNVFINNSVLEGYEQGGIYIGSNSGEKTYIQNSIIKQCENKTNNDAIRLYGKTNGHAVSMGGTTNLMETNGYIDNCEIYGSKNAVKYFSNVPNSCYSLYISNSNIHSSDDTELIDLGLNTHRLYIGQGNNFTVNDVKAIDGLDMSTIILETNEVYKK